MTIIDKDYSLDLLDTLQAVAPVLARLGMKDDRAWAAYSRCIAAITAAEANQRLKPVDSIT